MATYKYFKPEHKNSLRKFINNKVDNFTEFELKFLVNVYNRQTYSSKQWDTLTKICTKFDLELETEYTDKENSAIKSINKSSHLRNRTKTSRRNVGLEYSDRYNYRK